jgi:hypothetical protein
MNVYCAWCGALLRSVPEGSDPLGPHDSHGICADCARALLQQLGIPIEEFLSELGVPVLLVSDDIRVVEANPAALTMLERAKETVLGHLGGEVFEGAGARCTARAAPCAER